MTKPEITVNHLVYAIACYSLVASQEDLAAVNINKYRKVQAELEDAEERAEAAENTLQKLRAKNRSSVSCARTFSTTPVTLTALANV